MLIPVITGMWPEASAGDLNAHRFRDIVHALWIFSFISQSPIMPQLTGLTSSATGGDSLMHIGSQSDLLAHQ